MSARPLYSDRSSERHANYGIADEEGQKIEEDIIKNSDGISPSYNLDQLITFRVFGVFDGTVLLSKTLWLETGVTALIFWVVFFIVLHFRPDSGFGAIIGSEASIRAFISMFSTLIGLLLSFYTSLNLGRWWGMRMGVQNIEEGCKELVMMVSQGCSDDKILLDTISRYAQASLYLIFAASQNKELGESPRLKALEYGLLTQEEADKLERLNPHMPFVHAGTLWVWLANAVTRLHDLGLTKGAPHYCALMACVEQGRVGIANIRTYLDTPIPLGYVHLLCLMVKLHNVILTILMALACVMLAGGDKGLQPVGMFRTSFRAFFMPFLYNAILILNQEVTDPFGGDAGDFQWSSMRMNIKMSSESYANAATHLPEWVTDHEFKPPASPAKLV